VSTGTSSDSRDLDMTPIANGSYDSGDLGCDALVFFGGSGDLPFKQIFPALAALVKRGLLGVPMIGVARAGWTEEQFVERARRSLEDHRILDEARFGRFASLDLRKIDVPRLVVHGTADRILPIEATRARTHEMVKDSQYVVIDDAPHGCIWTHADDVNHALLEFIGAAAPLRSLSTQSRVVPLDARR
jgi:pimeloyl-ACP methyl ester carboxylesterase